MKKQIITTFLLLLLFNPIKINAMNISSRNAIATDLESGRVLYEKRADEKHLIASITKIMTSVIAIESGKTEDIITTGEEVLSMYGSNIYLELGEKMKMKDMIYGLMLRSGNDAAIVLATYIGGTEEEFTKMMNNKASEIGMKNTYFANSHGLDEKTENHSTARDMAILSQYANKLPLYQEIAKTKKYKVNSLTKTYLWHNRNDFLYTYEFATGGKTGFTPRAGKTLVTTAKKEQLHITVVTLNDGNQYQTHKTLYDEIFEKYKNYLILDKNNFKIDNAYYKNNIYIKNSFSYPLTELESNQIKVLIQLTKKNNQKNNEQVGTAIVYLNGEVIKEEPVYINIERPKNIWDKIRSWFT